MSLPRIPLSPQPAPDALGDRLAAIAVSLLMFYLAFGGVVAMLTPGTVTP